MSARPGTVWYWLGVGVAVALIAAAVLWNAWTFNQHRIAQRQLDSLGVDLSASAADNPASDSAEAAELELLLDADRRGILEENFQALLTAPQKRAIAAARRDRLAERAGDRRISVIVGAIFLLIAFIAYGAGWRGRR